MTEKELLKQLSNCTEFYVNFDSTIVATCDDFSLVYDIPSELALESDWNDDPMECVNSLTEDQSFLKSVMINNVSELQIVLP